MVTLIRKMIVMNLGPDPSNDEYIPVVKKVSLDSLVEFSPHELNSCRHRFLVQQAESQESKFKYWIDQRSMTSV